MKRIEDNEKRLDKLNTTVSNLENDLENFKSLIHDYYLLNDYYGSKEWFKDKDKFEKGKIKNVKAGVLSEDAVWNLDENISETLAKMKEIISLYEKKEE